MIHRKDDDISYSSLGDILEEAQKVANSISYDEDAHSQVKAPKNEKARAMPTLVLSEDTEDKGKKVSPRKTKRRTWKKPADKPKRPLSAYNIFFQLERRRMVNNEMERPFTAQDIASVFTYGDNNNKSPKRRHRKTHGKISFADLARNIGAKWKRLDQSSRKIFEERANQEKKRYKKELEGWMEKQAEKTIKSKKESTKPKVLRKVSLDPSSSNGSFESLHASSNDKSSQVSSEEVSPPIISTPTRGRGTATVPQFLIRRPTEPRVDQRGYAFMQYQTILQRNQQQLELEMHQMAVERHIMGYNMPSAQARSYPQVGSHLQVDPCFSSRSHQASTSDYFEMADKTFIMAQKMLPSAARRFKPRVSLEMSSNRLDLPEDSQFENLEDDSSFSSLSPSTDRALPDDCPAESLGESEFLTLDPHQGLSSPAFEGMEDDLADGQVFV